MTLSNSTAINRDASPLSDFQQSFGQFLREQRPALSQESMGLQDVSVIPNRISSLYQALIFNNVRGFLDKCFPVCQSLISQDQWLQVCKQFFAQYDCDSPYCTEINQHFVDYLALPKVLDDLNLPPYFADLAHYEWIELKVDTCCNDEFVAKVSVIKESVDKEPVAKVSIKNIAPSSEPVSESDDLSVNLGVNSTLQNLHYQWPVHLISAKFKPTTAEDSFYLVYRDSNDQVQFMQANALTHALIDFIRSQPTTTPASISGLTRLMQDFANHVGYEEVQVLLSFGVPLIQQLIEQQVLYVSP